MISCVPSDLVKAARCFHCVPRSARRWVKAFLLCQLAGGGAPFNLDISGNSSSGNIILMWSQTGAGDQNQIWRSVNGGAFVQIASIAGSLTTYTDPSAMANGDQWYYQVRSVKGGTASSFTQQAGVFFGFQRIGQADVTINFPDLVVALGSFIAQNEANLTTVSVPRLHHALGGSGFLVDNSNLLATVDVSALVYADRFTLSAGTRTSVNLPHFVSAGTGGFDISVANNVASINIPVMVSTGGNLLVNALPALTSISFPTLTSIVDNLFFSGDTVLSSISFPVLKVVGSGGGNLDGGNCPALTSASFPALQTIGGLINFVGSNNLASFSAPNWILTDGTQILFTGLKLNAASVNQILARGVASGVIGCDFELAGGTNAAPSGQGVADKATLIGLGNTVNTN